MVDTSNKRASTSHLNIHRRIEKIIISLLNPNNVQSKEYLKDKGYDISLKHSGEEEIFNNLVSVNKVRKNGTLMIELS